MEELYYSLIIGSLLFILVYVSFDCCNLEINYSKCEEDKYSDL